MDRWLAVYESLPIGKSRERLVAPAAQRAGAHTNCSGLLRVFDAFLERGSVSFGWKRDHAFDVHSQLLGAFA